MKKKVVLCTGSSSETDKKEQKYKKILSEINVECIVLEVLDFEFINLDKLEKQLLEPDSYHGNYIYFFIFYLFFFTNFLIICFKV